MPQMSKAKLKDVHMYRLDLESPGSWPTMSKNFPDTDPQPKKLLKLSDPIGQDPNFGSRAGPQLL